MERKWVLVILIVMPWKLASQGDENNNNININNGNNVAVQGYQSSRIVPNYYHGEYQEPYIRWFKHRGSGKTSQEVRKWIQDTILAAVKRIKPSRGSIATVYNKNFVFTANSSNETHPYIVVAKFTIARGDQQENGSNLNRAAYVLYKYILRKYQRIIQDTTVWEITGKHQYVDLDVKIETPKLAPKPYVGSYKDPFIHQTRRGDETSEAVRKKGIATAILGATNKFEIWGGDMGEQRYPKYTFFQGEWSEASFKVEAKVIFERGEEWETGFELRRCAFVLYKDLVYGVEQRLNDPHLWEIDAKYRFVDIQVNVTKMLP